MSGLGYDAHGIAIGHLVSAMGAARKGDHQKAAQHLEHANRFATGHAQLLKVQGQTEDAIRYMDSFRTHERTIRGIMTEKGLKDTKKSDVCKAGICKGNTCKCEKIEKADQTPRKVGAPTGQPDEYDYKMIHDLHPEDQMRAQRFFNHKDVGRFKYPVDKASGRIVHGQRLPISAGEEQAKPGQYQEMPSHLREGAGVRIHAPGTKFHGRFGVVSNQSSFKEGKTAVHVGNMTGSPIHFPHDMLHPSKPSSKFEKALLSLKNFRKAFLK